VGYGTISLFFFQKQIPLQQVVFPLKSGNVSYATHFFNKKKSRYSKFFKGAYDSSSEEEGVVLFFVFYLLFKGAYTLNPKPLTLKPKHGQP
jgi:hypothetical protein